MLHARSGVRGEARGAGETGAARSVGAAGLLRIHHTLGKKGPGADRPPGSHR